MKLKRDDIIRANQTVHTQLADFYNNDEPHFRPENVDKVRNNLTDIFNRYDKVDLLDIGCGTGFIINIVKDLCENIYGIDATQAMLDQIKEVPSNVHLQQGIVEELPFENEKFEVVTSYSFLHHLYDYNEALKEAYRVLKPGGTFYIDLEPNKYFWDNIKNIDFKDIDGLSDILKKEVQSVNSTGEKLNEKYNVNPEEFDKAEYYKNIIGGIDFKLIEKQLIDIGFKKVQYELEWFLGEGYYIHNKEETVVTEIRNFLKSLGPLNFGLYKYIKIIAVK